jgi:V-type H+-transporting ATPase subunit H
MCHNPQDVELFAAWATDEMQASFDGQASKDSLRGVVTALMVLLRSEKSRTIFVNHQGIPILVQVISSNGSNAQLIYEACFCLWCLSFNEDTFGPFQSSNAVRMLATQISAAPREKVVRVAIAALRNLAAKPDLTSDMIDAGLLKTLGTLKDRKWGDEDVTEDIEYVRDKLVRNFKELSSIERYEKEVKQGNLEWGFLHTEKFWREHAKEFEKEDFYLVKLLIELLQNDDPVVAQVACYDIGEFARFYPNGKTLCKHLGAKPVVMQMLAHQNADVQKQALLCVSKMMVNNWEFVK